MWKTQLMKYKEECVFLPNLFGSSYLSPVLETQGRSDGLILQLTLADKLPVSCDGITSTKGSPFLISVVKLPPASRSFAWKRVCVRPEEPRPVEFNMNFYCHGKVLVIQTYIKLEFINPFKAGQAAVPVLVGLFCLLLFHLFYYFVIYWRSDKSWEQRNADALGWTRRIHAAELLDTSGCAKWEELVCTISATGKLKEK